MTYDQTRGTSRDPASNEQPADTIRRLADQTREPSRAPKRSPARRLARDSFRWRTVDIVVAAVLGVAFGVVFFLWNNLWSALGPAIAWFPPAEGVIYGVWLLPGVLGGLVIRKAGAALFTEVVAAAVSALIGWSSPWSIVLYGVGEGALAEIAFAGTGYRRWGRPTAVVAGALAGVGPGIADPILYYPTFSTGFRIAYLVIVVLSSAAIAGLGSWALVRALRPTGVLAPFASGRTGSA